MPTIVGSVSGCVTDVMSEPLTSCHPSTSTNRSNLNGSEISTSGGNTVNESVSALQANIVDNLAMKLAYRVKYTSDVPSDTDTTDPETTASVLYSF